MARDFPHPEGFPGYGDTDCFMSQQRGQRVSSLGIHLPADGDECHADDDAGDGGCIA
jgi:hypothetical protein